MTGGLRRRHRVLGVVALSTLLATAVVDTTAATSGVRHAPDAQLDSVLVDRTTRQVAPGLDLVSYQRLEPRGWNTGNVLVADLDTPTLSMDVVNSGRVAAVATTKEQIAGRPHVVAAVNGDFFDINASGAPVGNDVSRQHGVLNGTARPTPALTVADGLAAIEMLSTDARAVLDGEEHQVDGVNTPHLDEGAIGLYTPMWGDYTLRRPLGAPDSMPAEVAEVTVVDGLVTEVDDEVDEIAVIPADGQVLVGRETGARVLLALEPGDPVDVTVQPSSPAELAVSGNVQLVDDGVAETFSDKTDHARTAVGLSRDGSMLYVATVDAAQGDSHGQRLDEMAQLMVDLGAYNAVNLDGGGSSTMYARLAGTSAPTLLNRPGDGSERRVANALAFFSTAPGGRLTGVATRPAIAAPTLGEDGRTLMPGLRRTIIGTGLDPNLAAMPTRGRFLVDGDARLRSTSDGRAVVTGSRPGRATVTYRGGRHADSTELTVVGSLDRLTASSSQVHLDGPEATASLAVTAWDADGNGVPVEPADVEIEVGDGFAIEPAGIDGFTVSTTLESGSTTARLEVGDEIVEVALTAGSVSQTVADFSDADAWTYGTDRASGSLAPAEGPDGQPGLGMTFDFTQSSNTRGSYAIAPQEIQLPGQPREVTMWLNGDAMGEWPRLQVRSADGVTFNLDGPIVDWTGWRRVSFPVPVGTAYPLTFTRIRIMEIRSTVSYHGALEFSDVAVTLAPDVELPTPARVYDPALVTNGTVDRRPQRIAVVSDAQFTADAPDGPLVQAARRTLREVVAARPDLLVIDGDFVDRGEAADLALAERVLDEEVPGWLPYVYVPGNHEIMGNPAADFSEVFGPTRTARTHRGTRVITLDSSTGGLHSGGLDQLHFLESQLESAARDRDVTGVVVFFHHPPDDFLPDDASQLSDRYEAAALQRVLAEFRARARKSVAVVNAHVGAFHTTSVDGVTYVTNGNSGKSPASTPDNGGFTGWSMLGLDPSQGRLPREPEPVESRTDWLRVETHARVDGLTLEAPAELDVGARATVRATVSQDDGRLVPVGWPVSATWTGERVTIVDGGRDSAGRSVLRLDPRTGELTALRRGRAVVAVEVNGERRRVEIVVR